MARRRMSPVKGRAEKAARILAAEEQLHRIEQWRMADLERRLAKLETMQIELICALNDTNALHGLFIDTTARRLSSAAEEAELVGREKAAQALRLKEHAARVKLCQRLAPRQAAASSVSTSRSSSTGCTVRTTKGRPMNTSAT